MKKLFLLLIIPTLLFSQSYRGTGGGASVSSFLPIIADSTLWHKQGTDTVVVDGALPIKVSGLRVTGNTRLDGNLELVTTVTEQLKLGPGSDPAPELSSAWDTNTGIRLPGSDVVTVITNGTERMRVGATGNITVGSIGGYDRLGIVSATSGQGTGFGLTSSQWNKKRTTWATARDTSAIGMFIDSAGGPRSFWHAADGDTAGLTMDGSEVKFVANCNTAFYYGSNLRLYMTATETQFPNVLPITSDTYSFGSSTRKLQNYWGSDNIYLGGKGQTATLNWGQQNIMTEHADSTGQLTMIAGNPWIRLKASDGDSLSIFTDGTYTNIKGIGLSLFSNSELFLGQGTTRTVAVGSMGVYPNSSDNKSLGVISLPWQYGYISDGLYLGGKGQTAQFTLGQQNTMTEQTDSTLVMGMSSGNPYIKGMSGYAGQSTRQFYFGADTLALFNGARTARDSTWFARPDGSFSSTGESQIGTSTDNTKMTVGLTIDQGTNDDEALTLKSTGDVAHGITTQTETNTYFLIKKQSGSDGGALLWGLADTQFGPGLEFRGTATAASATYPYIIFRASKKSTTTHIAADATEPLVNFMNYTTTVATLLGNGNFGLGTTAPAALLHVNNANVLSKPLFRLGRDNNATPDSLTYMVTGMGKVSISPNTGAYGMTPADTLNLVNIMGKKSSDSLFVVHNDIVGRDSVFAVLSNGNVGNNGVVTIKRAVSLADQAEYTPQIPAGMCGWGSVQIGDDQEWARFRFKADGTVTLEANSANVGTTNDTDTKLNIYDAGTAGIVIENQLGSTLTAAFVIECHLP